ncbi:DNA cytosine methyltransferase [Streptomyces sp. CL12]|uniref:DNA cytosine methyltransferase n=1 Tax=Streptomyces sp. CL12 TaxID=3391744 RepID=UPI003A8047FF
MASPVKDVSVAGRRAGLNANTRSGLWLHVARAVEALRPCLVVIENVRGLLTSAAGSPGDVEFCPWCLGDPTQPHMRALGAVLGSLANIGYDAKWLVLRAADVGAPHGRARVFLAAWPAERTVQDAHEQHREERGLPAPLEAQERRARPEPGGRGRVAVADPEGVRRDQGKSAAAPWERRPHASLSSGLAAADSAGERHRHSGTPTEEGVATASVGGGSPALGGLRTGSGGYDDRWGAYGPAIARWEMLTRPAPPPTDAAGRLRADFVEWMQGLEPGWVTDTPGLGRPAQLTALGNGVVPQQASRALELLAPPFPLCRRCTGP